MNYILVICTLAVGHSLFSAIALLAINRKRSNQLLALLLLLLSLRIGKSVVGLFFPEMVYGLSAVGLVAMAAAGPVLYILIQSLFHTASKISIATYLHFIPAVVLIIILPISKWTIQNGGYTFITAQMLVYILITCYFVFINREYFRADDLKWRWALKLIAGISYLWITFALQISVYQPFIYAANVIVAALVFYSLSLWAMKHARIFLGESKNKTQPAEQYDDLGSRIKNLLETEELFIDANLNVSVMADKLKVQPYLVSRAVNAYFKKTFSELLMEYRIRKSEHLLLAPDTKSYTIESIAYESGFNTLSAFYAAFKKIHKTTPAQFRKNRENPRFKVA